MPSNKPAPTHSSPLRTYYDPRMVASISSYSPSAQKPAALMEHWKTHGLYDQLDVHSFSPLAPIEVCAAHDAHYVKGILDGSIKNGFGTADAEAAKSFLWTNGSMLNAARYAMKNKDHALAPVSGFHHAGFVTA